MNNNQMKRMVMNVFNLIMVIMVVQFVGLLTNHQCKSCWNSHESSYKFTLTSSSINHFDEQKKAHGSELAWNNFGMLEFCFFGVVCFCFFFCFLLSWWTASQGLYTTRPLTVCVSCLFVLIIVCCCRRKNWCWYRRNRGN